MQKVENMFLANGEQTGSDQFEIVRELRAQALYNLANYIETLQDTISNHAQELQAADDERNDIQSDLNRSEGRESELEDQRDRAIDMLNNLLKNSDSKTKAKDFREAITDVVKFLG
jgi:flagellar biosynthesis chaperone FliJ